MDIKTLNWIILIIWGSINLFLRKRIAINTLNFLNKEANNIKNQKSLKIIEFIFALSGILLISVGLIFLINS